MIARSRNLADENSRFIALVRIRRNELFIHPENILLAVICDDSPMLRKFDWKRIQKAHMSRRNAQSEEDTRQKTIHLFQIPKTNF